MTRLEEDGQKLEVEQTMGFIRIAAIFFAVLTTLDVVASIASLASGGSVTKLLGPTIGGALATLVLGFMPHARSLRVSRSTGEAVFEQRALFRKRVVPLAIADVTGVRVFVGTYYKFVDLTRPEGGPLSILVFPKSWTWQTAAGAETLGRAQRIAAFFGVALDAPAS